MNISSDETSLLYLTELERYFPSKHGNWCMSSFLLPNELPMQGWKIHISATPVNALAVLRSVGDLIIIHRWQSKAIASLELLKKMNAGLFFGHSQIGKFITIYCSDHTELVDKIAILKEVTGTYQGPSIPSDMKVSGSGCLYYRYGNFRSNKDGKDVITDPDGNLLLDGRRRHSAVPVWAKATIAELTPIKEKNSFSLLENGYLVYDCLSQRGKGGVFRALSLFANPPEIVIVKEGRKYGEEEYAGRDGYARLLNEFKILTLLNCTGVRVPKIIEKIETVNRCLLVTNNVSGVTLDEIIYELSRKKRKLAIRQLLRLAVLLLSQICILHSAGICHRDIKPANLIMDINGDVSIIDFEGAFVGEGNLYDPWGSPGFIAPEWRSQLTFALRIAGDIYSIGATLFYLFTGSVYRDSSYSRENDYRKGLLPELFRRLIEKMLSPDPNQRPSASSALMIIEQMKPDTYPSHFLLRVISRMQRRNNEKAGTIRLTVAIKNDTLCNHIIHIYDRFRDGHREVSGSPFVLSAGEISVPFYIHSNSKEYIGRISIKREDGFLLQGIELEENMIYPII